MKSVRGAMACVLTALGACAGNGEGLDENGRPLDGADDTLQPTFSSIQQHVFTPICATCHSGAGAPLGLRLDESSSYALLVNAASVEVPSLRRVEPGNPDASYLIQKLEGTAAVGARMPLGQPPLPADTIAVIRQWIANGAQNDGAAASMKAGGAPPSLTAVLPQQNEELTAAPSQIVLTASAPLDLSLLQSDVISLRASGGDGSFDEGNEHAIAMQVSVRTTDPTVLAIAPLHDAWLPDTYELRVSGADPVALAGLNTQVIDGDTDGVPGGDFVLHFTVESGR
jgi:hypothetical protein